MDTGSGWMFSLRADKSQWGDYEIFHHSMFSDGMNIIGKRVVIELGDIFGVTYSKDFQLRVGDGIAIYHTERARFPNNDIFYGSARISLIGKIVQVTQAGRKVESLTIETTKRTYSALLTYPLIKGPLTEGIFQPIFALKRQVAWRPIETQQWKAISSYVDGVTAGRESMLDSLWRGYKKQLTLE